MSKGNGWLPMPPEFNFHNACTDRCDAAQGPCACGAWHELEEWPDDVQKVIVQPINKSDAVRRWCGERCPIPWKWDGRDWYRLRDTVSVEHLATRPTFIPTPRFCDQCGTKKPLDE